MAYCRTVPQIVRRYIEEKGRSEYFQIQDPKLFFCEACRDYYARTVEEASEHVSSDFHKTQKWFYKDKTLSSPTSSNSSGMQAGEEIALESGFKSWWKEHSDEPFRFVDKNAVYCKLCQQRLFFEYKRAITDHEKTAKHIKNVAAFFESGKLVNNSAVGE